VDATKRRTYAWAQLAAQLGQEGHHLLHVGLKSVQLGQQHFFKGEVKHLLHQIAMLPHLQVEERQQGSY
jgi:hypothetical protein